MVAVLPTSTVADMFHTTNMTVTRWVKDEQLDGKLVPRAGGGYQYEITEESVYKLLKKKRRESAEKIRTESRRFVSIDKSIDDLKGVVKNGSN